MISLQRPPVIAFLFLIVGLSVLVGLGYWQWDKYQIRMAERDACLDVEQVLYDQAFDKFEENMPPGCGGLVSGTVLNAPIIPVGIRMKNGTPGFDIHAIMLAEDGSSVLVNLGWSETETPPIELRNIHTIGGPLLKLHGKNRFSPSNKPEENKWFVVDVNEIQGHFKLGHKFSHRVLFADKVYDAEENLLTGFESPTIPKSYLNPMTHLQYAVFWFIMAGALLIIFIIRFCRKA